MGRRTTNLAHHRPRLTPDGVLLATALAVAAMTARHRSIVDRKCRPIACDVASMLPLYDADTAAAELGKLPRRQRVA